MQNIFHFHLYCSYVSAWVFCALWHHGCVVQVAVPTVGPTAATRPSQLHVPACCPSSVMASVHPLLHPALWSTQTSCQSRLETHKQSKYRWKHQMEPTDWWCVCFSSQNLTIQRHKCRPSVSNQCITAIWDFNYDYRKLHWNHSSSGIMP